MGKISYGNNDLIRTTLLLAATLGVIISFLMNLQNKLAFLGIFVIFFLNWCFRVVYTVDTDSSVLIWESTLGGKIVIPLDKIKKIQYNKYFTLLSRHGFIGYQLFVSCENKKVILDFNDEKKCLEFQKALEIKSNGSSD